MFMSCVFEQTYDNRKKWRQEVTIHHFLASKLSTRRANMFWPLGRCVVMLPLDLTWRKWVYSTVKFPSNLSVIIINNKVLWTSSQTLPLKESYNLFFKDQWTLCYILPAWSTDIRTFCCLVSKKIRKNLQSSEFWYKGNNISDDPDRNVCTWRWRQ
jgi:hypothetical protein